MLPSQLETVLERPLCSLLPCCLDTGSSLYEGRGLKLFYKHLGHGDTKNIHCCGGKSLTLLAQQNTPVSL